MTMQTIKSVDGQEFVLLPAKYYERLESLIEKMIIEDRDSHLIVNNKEEYVPFVLEDYVKNPVALARINLGVTQKELADLMQVTQGYISQIENSNHVSAATMLKVMTALRKK